MKVVFTAFNHKLWSKIEELPENTSMEFRLPWPMDVMVKPPTFSASAEMGTIRKMGLFRYTGKNYMVADLLKKEKSETDEDREWVKEYALVDIS